MKIKLNENYLGELDLSKFKDFLIFYGYKGDFSFKIIKECPSLDIKFKEKIDKKIKKLIPFVIKGQIYDKFLSKKGFLFKCHLTGIDPIVLPLDSNILEKILEIKEIIPYDGLKKGLEAYLKMKKMEKIYYLLILNLKEKDFRKYFPFLFSCLFKGFILSEFEIKEFKSLQFCQLVFKKSIEIISPEGFAIFLENFAKTIYVEKNLQNGL